MEYLFENPIPTLMIGAVLFTFTAVMYATTRSTGAFIAAVLVAVMTLSALVMEQIVYTERELVEVAITGITDAAEANDLPRVQQYLAPTATRTRAMAEKLMPELDITKANVMGEVEITLDDEKNPKHATAKFRGFFHAKHKSGFAGGKPFPVTVELVRDRHRWMIEDFRSSDDFEAQAAKLMK